MIEEQKTARLLTTIFTVSLILLAVSFYFYLEYARLYPMLLGFITEALFAIFIFTGFIGTYKTIIINSKLEFDMEQKLKALGITYERVGYNSYKLDGEAKMYRMDLNSIPSDSVVIDHKKRIIKYT